MAEEVSTFVQRRGATKSRTGFGVGGAIGAAINTTKKDEGSSGDRGDPGELFGVNGIGKFSVGDGEVTIFKGKGGFPKPKATDEVLATARRDEIKSASFDGKMLMGVLVVEFVDGSRWEFDVPRQYRKSATEVAQALGG